MSRTKQAPLDYEQGIRWKSPGISLELVYFTNYKGAAFEGWIERATFERLEREGDLTWGADGSPVLSQRIREQI